MHHDKYDYSDITCSSSSSAPSSSSASPKRSVLYYVDSPSSRSESQNDAASPLYSPSPAPPPLPSSSSSSNLSPSSSYRPSSAATSRLSSNSPSPSPPLLGRSRKPLNPTRSYYCYAIREDQAAEDDDDDGVQDGERRHYYHYYGGYDEKNRKHRSRVCQTLSMAFLCFAALFGFFCLILWGAAQPFKPAITIEKFTMHNMNLGVGTDYTGVPTRLLTLNCTVDMSVRNPATFFGIHLHSLDLQLMYSRITIATGQIRKYYQRRKSRKMVKVKVEGYQVPLYGVGESLAKSERRGKVPVRLVFRLLSKGDVIGKLLRVQHKKHISCSLFIARSDLNKPIKLEDNSCIYK